jgi:hypothetical protein
VTALRSRRVLASLTLLLALGATACSGGDAIPNEPAEGAGDAAPGAGGDTTTDTGTLGGGDDELEQPPGLNQPVPDPGGDLEEPTE